MKTLITTLALAATIGTTAVADMSLTCISKDQGTRMLHVDEGWTDKMTVWNPETPRIKIRKNATEISRGHFKAFENDAWIIIFDKNKGLGSLTNKVFGDKYACF